MSDCTLKYPQDPECSGEVNDYKTITVCEKHARIAQELLLIVGETNLTTEEINALTPAGRILLVNKLVKNEK